MADPVNQADNPINRYRYDQLDAAHKAQADHVKALMLAFGDIQRVNEDPGNLSDAQRAALRAAKVKAVTALHDAYAGMENVWLLGDGLKSIDGFLNGAHNGYVLATAPMAVMSATEQSFAAIIDFMKHAGITELSDEQAAEIGRAYGSAMQVQDLTHKSHTSFFDGLFSSDWLTYLKAGASAAWHWIQGNLLSAKGLQAIPVIGPWIAAAAQWIGNKIPVLGPILVDLFSAMNNNVQPVNFMDDLRNSIQATQHDGDLAATRAAFEQTNTDIGGIPGKILGPALVNGFVGRADNGHDAPVQGAAVAPNGQPGGKVKPPAPAVIPSWFLHPIKRFEVEFNHRADAAGNSYNIAQPALGGVGSVFIAGGHMVKSLVSYEADMFMNNRILGYVPGIAGTRYVIRGVGSAWNYVSGWFGHGSTAPATSTASAADVLNRVVANNEPTGGGRSGPAVATFSAPVRVGAAHSVPTPTLSNADMLDMLKKGLVSPKGISNGQPVDVATNLRPGTANAGSVGAAHPAFANG